MTVSELCSLARVSRPDFYVTFPQGEFACFTEVCRHAREVLVDTVKRACKYTAPGRRAHIRAGVSATVNWTIHNPGLARLLLLDAPTIKGAGITLIKDLVNTFAAMIEPDNPQARRHAQHSLTSVGYLLVIHLAKSRESELTLVIDDLTHWISG